MEWDVGMCGVCRRVDLTREEALDHRRRHGERRYELAKARVAAQALARVPRGTPGYAFLALLAKPRVGVPREERLLQNLDALLASARQPGGEAFARTALRAAPGEAEEMLSLAMVRAPEKAARLRSLMPGPEAGDADHRDLGAGPRGRIEAGGGSGAGARGLGPRDRPR